MVTLYCRSVCDVLCSVFVSSSTGKISSMSLNEAGQLVGLRLWSAHEHEAWIVAADRWNTNIIYSGIVSDRQ